jgi:uncharacterized protein YjbI with pentapeptide repeats
MPIKRQALTAEEFIARLADGATLRNLELRDADLAQSVAESLTLRDSHFEYVTFTHVDWESLTCVGCTFVNCQFLGARLVSATFTKCDFFDAETRRACSFAGAKLRFATFAECTLDSCLFEGADLFRVTIKDSRAIGANFYKAAFDRSATLTGAVLRYADLRDADLAGCDLSKSDFEWANLERVNLEGAILRDASLDQASLRGANLRGADLRNANLGGFDPRLADASGALIFAGQARQIAEALGMQIADEE